MRKEWNETVDRALAAGASEEEVQEIKKNFIDKPVAVSIKENGKQPDLFRRILLGAIEQLLKLLHKMHDLTTMIPDTDSVIDKAEEDTASKATDLLAAESELKYLQGIIDSIGKKEKRIYAIEKSVEDLEKHLEEIRNKWFHGKEKKELENQIYGKKLQMNKLKTELAEYPKMYGFKSVYEVKMAYKKAKAKVNKLKSEQTEGVQKPAKIPEKKNIHTRLGEKKKQVTKQQKSSVKKKQLEL